MKEAKKDYLDIGIDDLSIPQSIQLCRRIEKIRDKIGVCGCGSNASWEAIILLLKKAEEGKMYEIFEDTNPFIEFSTHVLNEWGLLEHGGSIGGSWLSEEGKILLLWLRYFGAICPSENFTFFTDKEGFCWDKYFVA